MIPLGRFFVRSEDLRGEKTQFEFNMDNENMQIGEVLEK